MVYNPVPTLDTPHHTRACAGAAAARDEIKCEGGLDIFQQFLH